jgi:hypothetical protein
MLPLLLFVMLLPLIQRCSSLNIRIERTFACYGVVGLPQIRTILFCLAALVFAMAATKQIIKATLSGDLRRLSIERSTASSPQQTVAAVREACKAGLIKHPTFEMAQRSVHLSEPRAILGLCRALPRQPSNNCNDHSLQNIRHLRCKNKKTIQRRPESHPPGALSVLCGYEFAVFCIMRLFLHVRCFPRQR